jgi:hypothetical protein
MAKNVGLLSDLGWTINRISHVYRRGRTRWRVEIAPNLDRALGKCATFLTVLIFSSMLGIVQAMYKAASLRASISAKTSKALDQVGSLWKRSKERLKELKRPNY